MSDQQWWRDAVVYQIYPRSFADSNGDGIGDLPGITAHLDHLAWLGVDALWLSPVFPSPNADWGYDVADYLDIHPDLGTLADADELIREAGERDIRILFDLVPNHTSDQHAWFRDARTSRDAPYRDFYTWADPAPDGGPPNNWISNFGGPAWTLDEATGQYYLHNFLAEQPDLNWWNPAVADAFDDILRFWFDRGVAGFRIDVCHMVVKDRELRDNPPAEEDDPLLEQMRGQRQVFNADRPEVHDVLRRWRGVARDYEPERLLLGEVYLWDLHRAATYLGVGADDELQLAFNIPFVHAALDPSVLSGLVAETEQALASHAWPCWTGSNHDAGRLASRWCGGDERRTRVALMMLATLRGTLVLYYGDEIGLTDVPLEYEQLLDPVGQRFHPYAGRDPGRTPMPWSPEPGGGFTASGVEPWLPFGDLEANSVAAQRDDDSSVLHFTRELLRLRRSIPALREGGYEEIGAPEGVWAWRRGGDIVVALNMSDAPASVDGLRGDVLLSTEPGRDGTAAGDGRLALAPWEGVVLRT